MRRMLVMMLLALLAVLGLAACSEADSPSLAQTLPLDAETPTLVFFYTDG